MDFRKLFYLSVIFIYFHKSFEIEGLEIDFKQNTLAFGLIDLNHVYILY